MRRFILGWKTLGYARRFRAEIVNYADDLCVLGKAPAAEMLAAVERLMAGLKLPVNERKTRCLRCPEEAFEFLGYRIGRNYRPNGKGAYIGTRPSKASVQSICRKISDMTKPRYGPLSSEVVVERLNRTIVGWGELLQSRQRQPGLQRGQSACGQAATSVALSETQDAIREIRALPGRPAIRRLWPHASHAEDPGPFEREGMILSESRMREIRMSGLMSGGLETRPWEPD